MRDKLIELVKKADETVCGFDIYGDFGRLADELLANGVIVPPCKIGDTAWVYNQSTGKIYENVVVCLKVVGTSRYKNTIRVEYHNAHGESSCRKFQWAQIGKQVFFTKEEAERALKEREKV